MAMKKNKAPSQSATGIKQGAAKDSTLRFSFKLFDPTDGDVCPQVFRNGYVQTLMDRMKSLSTWTVSEFVTPQGKAARNHTIDWDGTARPNGFAHLPEQYEAYPAFQFSLSANEHGRVHGLLIDDTFHVIWLDHDHKLYP